MANQSKVVISTAGPFALYGTPLVNCCAAYGTDYVDITGEVDWVRHTICKFEDLAVKTGARIISCCGADSIPWDLNVFLMNEKLKKENPGEELRKVLFLDEMKGSFSGGTFAS